MVSTRHQLDPGAQSGLVPVFIDKVVMDSATLIRLRMVCDRSYRAAELTSAPDLIVSKYLLFRSLQKIVANPHMN